MLSIWIYSKPNCVYCTRAKHLLNSRGHDYTEKVIGTDITLEDFKAEFPNARTVPQIVINGKNIGGYDDLVLWFEGTANGFGEQAI